MRETLEDKQPWATHQGLRVACKARTDTILAVPMLPTQILSQLFQDKGYSSPALRWLTAAGFIDIPIYTTASTNYIHFWNVLSKIANLQPPPTPHTYETKTKPRQAAYGTAAPSGQYMLPTACLKVCTSGVWAHAWGLCYSLWRKRGVCWLLC